MKRFWHSAKAAPDGEFFTVYLDQRVLRVPEMGPLKIPYLPLAEAIAAEWNLAGGDIGGAVKIDQLAMTRLAATAFFRIEVTRDATIDAIAKYGESDLLCYRAAHPEILTQRQAASWQKWLDWAAKNFDAKLRVTSDIGHVAQSPAALTHLRAAVARHDTYQLAALGVTVPALGSLVLGLAVASGALAAAEAAGLSQLDELFQEELWGEDAEGIARRATVTKDICEAARFARLAR
jgi:chaperone required for assembly of F1-ATPase